MIASQHRQFEIELYDERRWKFASQKRTKSIQLSLFTTGKATETYGDSGGLPFAVSKVVFETCNTCVVVNSEHANAKMWTHNFS